MNTDRLLCKAKALVKCDTYCNKGDWVTGYLAPNSFDRSDFVIVIKWESGMGGIRIPVDTSTICQCTGLKDKNGQLIFEGDVITWETWDDYDEPWFMVKGHVYRYERRMQFRIKGYDGHHNALSNIMKEKLEIIGNIHDKEVDNVGNM